MTDRRHSKLKPRNDAHEWALWVARGLEEKENPEADPISLMRQIPCAEDMNELSRRKSTETS